MKSSVSACLLFFVAVPVCFAAAPQSTISGRVLDPTDNAIPGIQIQAYRDHRSIGNPVTSSRNGEYRVEFDSGTPLDTVRYDHSDWYPGTVENISGKNDHTVHKVLYRRGKPLSPFEAEDVICAFERIAEIDAKNDTRQKSLTQYKYREALDEIEKLSLPPELRERIKEIKRKYGIPVTPTSQPPA